jgi:arylsulfatase A-like enzyme
MTQVSRPRPNVIWIFGDQHRAHALGCMGDPNVHTPNIDRMANEGVTCRGVSGFPLCCPYRGALISGRYPHRAGAVPGHERQLSPELPTVATAFRDAGYHTAYIGKWHLDGFREREGRAAFHIIPPQRRGGFDRWVGYENNNSQFDCWVHGDRDFLQRQPGADSGRVIDDQTLHYRLPGYEADALTDLLIAHLREQATSRPDQPLFAALSVQPPHDPFIAEERWMQRHTPGQLQLRDNVPAIPWVTERARRDLAGYYAMVENLDWNVGRVRAALTELGIADDTYLIFFSDHGEMAGSHGQFAKMSPYEESIAVPFILAGGVPFYESKRSFEPGAGNPSALVNHVDIAPTSLGLCGIDMPDSMEGTDYSGLYIRGRAVKDVPDSAYLQVIIPTGHENSVNRPWRGIVTRDGWKYICFEGQPWLMFNLRDDPFELANHAHNNAFKAQRLKLHERLAQWVSDTGDSFDLPPAG